jgi:hypothetical protein
MPAKAQSGRSSLSANQTTSLFLISRFGSGAHSAKLFNGTRHRFSGLSQPRQCGELVLRMLVTGGPPVRGGGGMTEHDVAIYRAGAAAERLDRYIESLRACGAMCEFTKAYKRRRIAAAERGEGFMTFKIAEARFRHALIPLLMNAGQPVIGASPFAEIFRR